MGSVACSNCGRVRFAPDERCPGCGAAPTEILSPRGLRVAPARSHVRRIIDTHGRIIPEVDEGGWRRLGRNRRVEIVVAAVLVIALVGAVLYSADPALFGLGSGSHTQIVLPAGSTENLTGGDPLAWHEFETVEAGTLPGSFTIRGGPATVYVCNGTQYSEFNTWGPIGYTWTSGLVVEGTLRAQLSAGELYFVGGWPEVGNYSTSWPPTPIILTWTTALEFSY